MYGLSPWTPYKEVEYVTLVFSGVTPAERRGWPHRSAICQQCYTPWQFLPYGPRNKTKRLYYLSEAGPGVISCGGTQAESKEPDAAAEATKAVKLQGLLFFSLVTLKSKGDGQKSL